MSAAGAAGPDITLDELERLIRILGMIGSAHDGEVLAAAKFAQKWVVEHQTDWRTLLTPPAEPGVVAVVAPADPDEIEAAHQRDRAESYRNGYQAGLAAMAAQVKAQAAAATGPSRWAQNFATMAQNAPGGGLGGLGAGPGSLGAQQPQGPVRPPGGSGGASWSQPGASNPHPAGSWQDIAWALLNRDAQGIPGVFRGSREQDFVASLLARGWPSLTGPQETWLRDIAGRSGLTW